MTDAAGNRKHRHTQPDVVVYVCGNSVGPGARLPAQWKRSGFRVALRRIPCSGKIDARYLFGAFEGGCRGVCVVACPVGQCQYAEGNYRADIRLKMIGSLLDEIGLDAERVKLLHWSPDDPAEGLIDQLNASIDRLRSTGPGEDITEHTTAER